MASLSIRNLDDGTAQRLREQAMASNRSLEGHIRHLLETHVPARAEIHEILVIDELDQDQADLRAHEFFKWAAANGFSRSCEIITIERETGHALLLKTAPAGNIDALTLALLCLSELLGEKAVQV